MAGVERRKTGCGRLLHLGLAAAVALTAAGCGNGEIPRNGVEASGTALEKDDEGSRTRDMAEWTPLEPGEGRDKVTDFGLRLLQLTMEEGEENILVSPLSVMSALAMTANGAKGETLRQMEEAFGASARELSAYLSAYAQALPESEKYKLSLANSIWFTDDEHFTVEQDFLKRNEEELRAEVYRTAFGDSTVREINRWVEENTDGMIEEIVDAVPPEAVMYLVNALAFDAQWQEIYLESQVREGDFTGEDGRVQKTDMMYSTEYRYLEDESAAGFLKYYEDARYAFAALLPHEGVTVTEYVASLTGERLREILDHPGNETVYAAIPKFESGYGVELSKVLGEMGMTDAFSAEDADFSGIGSFGEGNLYIGRVLHKTYIAVDERGTRAGAATAVEVKEDGAAFMEPKRVCLDRPFLYMIIDCDTNLPIFIGVCRQVR